MTYWKILTHDFRSPIHGGEPLFDGKTFPFELPTVALDVSSTDCGAGWNYVRDIETGLKIAGMWPNGRPSSVFEVEPVGQAVDRDEKSRSEGLRLIRSASTSDVKAALVRFSAVFGKHADAMAEEQWKWYVALGRPQRDRDAAVAGLTAALAARSLDWTTKEFGDVRAVWAAWAAWDARDTWDAWDARDAWDAWAARAAWAAWDARDTWDAWAARDAWDAWDAWAAWAARAALIVQFSARSGWITCHHHDYLTTGIRDAYTNGLGIAVPTGPRELGWAMDPEVVL
jgi:pyochelin synthetase